MCSSDLKPDAPETHRGEFKPIKTNADGVMISEHLPKLAKCADKFAILRGVSHTLAAHELGTRYMNTGNRPLPSLNYPHYGAVVAKELRGTEYLPSFVAVPNLGENFSPATQTFANGFVDPCSAPVIAALTDTTVRANRTKNCADLGIPAGTVITYTSGIAGKNAGNRFLLPETSYTDTLSLILTPRFLQIGRAHV